MALLGISGLLGKYRNNLFDAAGAQGAILHLKVIQRLRRSLIGVVQFAISIIFFVVGIVISHCALFTFLNHESGQRAWILLILGFIEIMASIGYMIWFFSSERWVNSVAHFHPILKKAWAQRDGL